MSPDPAGNGDNLAGATVVAPAPVPFTITLSQQRGPDGRLYTVVAFTSAFATVAPWFDGEAGAAFLGVLTRIVHATKAGIELPAGGPHG